jgi:FkbM family methyltransferase
MGTLSNLIAKLLPESNLKSRFQDIQGIESLPIAEAGISEEMPFIRLRDGFIFYGKHPNGIQKIVYYLLMSAGFRQQVPEEACAVAWDIWLRYWRNGHIDQQRHYQLKNGDVVVEAGAYIGYYTLKMSQVVGPKGQVVAVEPVEENRRIIKKNLKANDIHNVIVLPYAVWNEKGTTVFHLTNWQKNSLLPEPLRGKGRIHTRNIPTNTIDQIIVETGISTPDFVIITVNGVEVEALQGMSQTLEKGTHLVIAAKYVIGGVPTYQSVTKLLQSQGYEVILDHYGFTKNENPDEHAVVYAWKQVCQ